MTFEFVVYIELFFLSIYFVSVKSSKIIYMTMSFISLIIYSVVVRYSGFDIDINNYANILSYDSLNNIYYIKEPIYWFSSKWMYDYFRYPKEINFIIFDTISFIIIYKACENFKLKKGVFLLLILFFPMLMGLQNVYRQYLAISFLIYSISFSYSGNNKLSFFYYIIAGLTHNAAFLFLPLLFIYNHRNKKLLTLSVLFVSIILPFSLSTKSNDSSGLQLSYLYLILMFVTTGFFLILFNYYKTTILKTYVIYIITLLYISSISVLLMGSSQGERIGMMSFMLTIPILITIIDDLFKQKKLTYIILSIIIILPTFIFPSARQFLFT